MESIVLFFLCLTLPLLILLFFHKLRSNKNSHPLPGPRGFPIIGNLLQLNDPSTLHLQLWKLSKIYGPLFSLQLGLRPAIVVSSPKLAKEILKNHDLVFSGRPSFLGQKKLSYNGIEVIFSPYNDSWREIRKICIVHVFNSKRVSCFSSIRHYEVKQMIKKISKHVSNSTVTNLSELLISLSSTIICRIAFGRSYEDEETEKSRFHGLFNEVQAMFAVFFVSDYVPFMGWIDKLTGMHARLDRIFKEMDKFYQEVIDERQKMENDEEVIVDVLLQLKKERSFSIDLTYDHIKAILMDILVAATDTTAATVVWAMTALIKNPRVMKKVQEEIRKLGGKKDFIGEDDIKNLSYLKAVIKETLRLYLPAPLLVPREASEDCIIDGYQIQAKTIVYVNIWAIQRDSEVWEDPEEFYPERFLESFIDFKG
ncbi:unnamed protein product [Lupinus luteus]|uniref:Cytochrome P450 83B1 n=1 Tax=Lupinus luteus TaxID=3873 RepID=A0AAV1XTJ4_LUPLU